jgi:hypothetical protein
VVDNTQHPNICCAIEGCNNPPRSRGKCRAHYNVERAAIVRSARLVEDGASTPEGQQECRRCHEVKDFVEFDRLSRRQSGYDTICKECHYPRRRNQHLINRYGITLAEFEDLLAEQGGCAICGAATSFPKAFPVDHDRARGCDHEEWRGCKKCIRGILCNRCNTQVGWLENNRDAIESYVGRTAFDA